MTAYRPHHLPAPDDAALQRAFDALEDAGVGLSPRRRANLCTVHQFGLMDGPDGVGAMLLDAAIAAPGAPAPAPVPTVEAQAAQTRRMVRHLREDGERPVSHRAVFLAAENHPPTPRYQVSKDGKTFYHPACDRDLPGGIDTADTHDKATEHHHTCEAVRDV